MKEIINIIVIIAFALGGTAALKEFHDSIRNAALEKSAKGLPSLEKMSQDLRKPARHAQKH